MPSEKPEGIFAVESKTRVENFLKFLLNDFLENILCDKRNYEFYPELQKI
jgi:hypothetical protein